jgi:ABC-type multidrug transport system ATPase subunit
LAVPVIAFSEAVKAYGEKRIGPVTFSVGKGEIFGFLGPNGSGKTTCIRMLLGLVRPSTGRVQLNGLDPLFNHVEALDGVGYSPELPNIQSFLTPREVLRLAAAETGLKLQVDVEVDRVLEEVGIINYRDFKVGKLSKGMVQRLSVALAMLGSPGTMILDEPMIGLDPAGTAHLREVFRAHARAGGTILMSSHMMSEVEDLCSTVGMIHNGRLVFNGALKDMVSQVLASDEVHVEATGLAESTLESVRRIEGVLSVERTEEGFEVKVKTGAEVRPAVARTITESGAQLLTISGGSRMLEKAYIEALKSGKDQIQ